LVTRLLEVLPAVVWMALIFLVSSQPAPELADDPLLGVILKKLAHASAYAILAVLLALALWRDEGGGSWLPQASWLAVAIAVGYAITDEIHQTFVPTRNGRPVDVLIDAVGAATAMAAVTGIHRLRKSRASE
jgi:VanZ family protein